ncbi:MAG: carboxylate-amine ligase [Rhodospirillaceae bacterium]|nr:carboxylate-amine ligase [Rhodospirillaceae bacterium]
MPIKHCKARRGNFLKSEEPALTIGIEEEYLLVDRETRELASDPPGELFAECEKHVPGLVRPEFMKAQIEVGTSVCKTANEARAQLAHLRSTIREISTNYGLVPIAASTHPSSEWKAQTHTDKDRYNVLADDMQVVARRLLISGMHVHIGIEDNNFRIDLLNQASYFLPHLLALSTSSPFWRGDDTGLQSYRISVFDELPRTGLPARFETYDEYRRHIDVLIKTGVIPDATMIWWDLRLSDKFPTVEMRITDICTYLDDAVAIAALYQCIARMLYRLRLSNQRWRLYDNILVNENRWRAQRYGTEGGMIDFGKAEMVDFKELMEELTELVAIDAKELGCVDEINHIHTIISRGTSASLQRKVYNEKIKSGAPAQDALNAVVDWLAEATHQY